MGDEAITTSLVQRAKAQDQEAWTRIVRSYSPSLEQRMVRCRLQKADRDALLNQIFSEVFRSLKTFEGLHGSKSFFALTWKIAFHCIGRQLKEFAGQRDRAVGGSDSQSILSSLSDEPSGNERSEMLSQFLSAMELNDKKRQILNLCIIGNTTAEDAAERLGMSAEAVRKAKSRLLSQIRQEGAGLGLW